MRNLRDRRFWVVSCLGWLTLCADPARSESPEAAPVVLTVEAAVAWGLQYNPALMTQREQHGIAAAGVVIAKTYPYNPEWQNKLQYTNGPASAGTTFRAPFETGILWQMQVHGQRGLKTKEAQAALSRTDWEIAFQEQTLAVSIIRACRTLLYRQEKIKLIELTVKMNEQAVSEVRKLLDQAKLRGADLLLAQTELDSAKALRGAGQAQLIAARYDLRRALGAVDEAIELVGTLEPPHREWDVDFVTALALDNRADLQAAKMGVAEVDARLRHAIADRCGDPSIGPLVNMDNTNDYYVGATINIPLATCNKHKGDILQRKAELSRAQAAVHQAEIDIRQDVQAALARRQNARTWANSYRKEVLPNLQSNLEQMHKLFLASEPGVDTLRVIDVRRRLLQARDSYLDALSEEAQAEADLATATGDPTLALTPPATVEEKLPAPKLAQ